MIILQQVNTKEFAHAQFFYLQNSSSNHDCCPTTSHLLGILKRQHVLSNIQLGCSDDEVEMENEGKGQDIVVL